MDTRHRDLPGAVDHLLVTRSAFVLSVCDSAGGVLREFRVALGRNVRGNRTPLGRLFISGIEPCADWSHDFRDGKGPVKGAYGPWMLWLRSVHDTAGPDAPRRKLAIHGTHDPGSIGTNASEGCIRLANDDLLELRRLVRTGTIVVVRE
jgi:hypothetical protein